MPDLDPNRWEEVINAVRGSCVWCKSAIYVCHLCELTVLCDEADPVNFGVDQISSYQKPSTSETRSPSILIERRLLVERDNPGRGLNGKCAVLACALAHEMAHHAMFDRLRINDGFRDLADISHADRKGVLLVLGAERYVKLAGVDLDVIGEHWAPSLEVKREQIGGDAREKETSTHGREPKSQNETAARLKIATEWAAAVIGCMVAKRYATNAKRVGLLRDKAFREFPSLQSPEISRVFEIACNSRDFEGDAERSATRDLGGAHRNPDIQSCSRRLKFAGLTWSSAPAVLRRV